ncbi:MAG: PEP-utilizing enzyme [Ruthenibacterium lactatiformans]
MKAAKMKKVVLVRLETSPEDIEGMAVAQGILTVRGGMTSHAAVVARGMGTCCVSGCGDIVVDYDAKCFTLSGKTYNEGDWISIDGSTGNIYGEAVPTVDASISGDFGRFMGWADAARKLEVFANADNPRDAKQAVEFGAEGIGLCRTEHMFFEADRIKAVREMIVARRRRGPQGRFGQDPAVSAGRLRGHVQGHGRAPDDHPLPGPAPPRVPAHQGRGHR